jgi:thiamine biosynthesis protein ThiS
MILNGKEIAIQGEISLLDFLTSQGYNIDRVAVEKNGIIIPKKAFETEMICQNDKLEVVHFVGGG